MSGIRWTIAVLLFLYACEQQEVNYTSIAGDYKCEENHPLTGYRTYLVQIDRKETEPDVYIISNFYNNGYDSGFILARKVSDSLIIDRQSSGGILTEGMGRIREDLKRIDWEYEVDDGMNMLNIQARYTR